MAPKSDDESEASSASGSSSDSGSNSGVSANEGKMKRKKSQSHDKHEKRQKVVDKESKKPSNRVISDEDEEDNEDEDVAPTKGRSDFIEEEASESDDDDGSRSKNSSDEEEAADDNNEYQVDGFVVNDLEDSESDNDDQSQRRRRKRKPKTKKLRRLKQAKEEDLDDEDLALIRENMGIEVEPTVDAADSDSEVTQSRDRKEKRGKSRKENDIFGSDSDDLGKESRSRSTDDSGGHSLKVDDVYDSDGMDEFIVSDDENKQESRRRPKTIRTSHAEGPLAYQMDEAEELFGSVEDLMEATREVDEGAERIKSKEKALAQIYEPVILKENLMTAEDNLCKSTDVPERYQSRLPGRPTPDAEERSEESEWIFTQLTGYDGGHGEVVSAIDNVLRFIQDDLLEIPYIEHYCKEYWSGSLKRRQLWQILELDERWDKLEQRRRSVNGILERVTQLEKNSSLNRSEEDTNDLNRHLEESYRLYLSTATESEMSDLTEFLQLVAPEACLQGGNNTTYKRAHKKDFYKICRKASLVDFARKFAISGTLLGASLLNISYSETPPTPKESPEELATQYICPEFPQPADVLKGAQYVLASEIALEPAVRSMVKGLYTDLCAIYTEPTQKGKATIDVFHYAHGLQYLEGKPLRDFLSYDETIHPNDSIDLRDQRVHPSEYVLKLFKAEKEGFLTIKFGFRGDRHKQQRHHHHHHPHPHHRSTIHVPSTEFPYIPRDFLARLEPLFCPGVDEHDLWYQLRHDVLQDALATFLIPSLESVVRQDMLDKAQNCVMKRCAEDMYLRLITRFSNGDSNDKRSRNSITVGFYVEDGRDGLITAVCLDRFGELVHHDKAMASKTSDVEKLIGECLVEYQPKLVIVSSNAHARSCYIYRLIGRISRGRHEVTYSDDDVARIYASSTRSTREFPSYESGVRAAVSMVRYVQNPVSELCGMWGMIPEDSPQWGKEVSYLCFHPLQEMLDQRKLLREYNRVFIDAVNSIGVDVNVASLYDHMTAQLQFVCGLGPRKAFFLGKDIQRNGAIQTRSDIVTNSYLGKTVYRNAIGFLRVPEAWVVEDKLLNPLDDTRIHPESYFMAAKMCSDAKNYPNVDVYDPMQYSNVVETVMGEGGNAANDLAELDLPAYANLLEQEQRGLKLKTLEDIKAELNFPFKNRCKIRKLTQAEIFFLTSGETKESLQKSHVATIVGFADENRGCYVRLSSGLRAFVKKQNLPLPRDWNDHNQSLESAFSLGGYLTGVADLKLFRDDVEKGRPQVTLICTEEGIKDVKRRLLHNVGDYFNVQLAEEDYARAAESLEPRSKSGGKKSDWKKRQILHPAFHNIKYEQEMEIMTDFPNGEAILRPSTRSESSLALVWKVYDGAYKHFDVKEVKNPSNVNANAYQIKNEIYEDIDELLARFITPMNGFVYDMVNHKNFRSGNRLEVEQSLISEKQKNPTRIPYYFRFSDKQIGSFAVSFIIRETVRHEHIQVIPKGFQFVGRMQSKTLPNVNEVVRYFKTFALNPKRPTTVHSSSSSSRHSSREPERKHYSSSQYSSSQSSTTNYSSTRPSSYGHRRSHDKPGDHNYSRHR